MAKLLYAVVNTFLEALRKLLWPARRPREAKRIAIYRIGNIGDIVCAIPAMVAIRRAYPMAHITLVTSPGKETAPGAKELLTGSDWLDEILVYYTEDVNTAGKRMAFIGRLRQMAFDLWFELPNDLLTISTALRNLWMARLANVQWAYGWRINTLRWVVQAQSENLTFPNEAERLLTLISQAGVERIAPVFPLPLREGHRTCVDQLLEKEGLLDKPLVAIAPGAKRPLNRWPPDRFSEEGRYALQKGFRVVVLGGEADAPLCQQVAHQIGEGAVSFAGRTSLLESCELLKRCRLLICNDSGVQHLAAAVGTPCISIFSFRDLKGKWNPYGSQHIVLQKWVQCHTCLLEVCPYDNLCIKLVDVDEVREAFNQSLGKCAKPPFRPHPGR